MRNSIVLLAIAVSFAAGCTFNSATDNALEADATPVQFTYQEEEGMEDAIYAEVSLSGMSCEYACGGAIKKCLKNMDGVIETNIEFDKEKEYDFVKVRLKEGVDEQKIVSSLSTLNDGQFKVKSVLVRTVRMKDDEQADEEEEDLHDVSMIQLPNIFDVFSRIF